MSRAFAFFLAFTLLFQMSWAVAATYCEHETSAAVSSHFGHHAHVHKAADAGKPIGSKLAVDEDCGSCHAGHAAIVATTSTGVVVDGTAATSVPQPSLYGSAPARAPDRPQWLRLA
ncbi:MAG: cobalt-zinc-cadmium resistance protein [Betaproteobacteria bacterium]